MFKLQNVSLSYEKLEVLDNFSIKGEINQSICLFGPSGVGKSSILNIIAGILKPNYGSITSNNEQLAYVFQEPRLLPWMTVEQNMEVGLYNFKKSSRWRKNVVRQLLPRIGLEKFGKYYPEQLSGGMKQRVSIGRAFVTQPDLLLLDEPFSGLDESLKTEMQDLILSLKNWHKCTTVMVTHDMQEAIKLSDRIIVLDDRPCRLIIDVAVNAKDKKNPEYKSKLEERIIWAKQNNKKGERQNDEKESFISNNFPGSNHKCSGVRWGY
ncbi:MAG TPA: ABC transporter ATP-binding protein [Syntrophomonadaceae bacterium]|nr:ABC transporter ATP-binding protein [Syntrophomonadaceae bacterium]